MDQFFSYIIAVLLGIVGYFLKNTMDKLQKLETYTYKKGGELEVLKTDFHNKYENLTEKFDKCTQMGIDLFEEERIELTNKITILQS